MRFRRIYPTVLLLIFFCLALSSVVGDSPTMDEQNHLARGLAYLRTGDPRLSVEHPPLVNGISALFLLTEPVRLPTNDWSWEAGEWYRFADQLLWHQGNEVERVVFLARMPIIFLGLLLGALLYRFARRWSGRAAGFLALALYVLDPNILAHARYSTTDLGGTAFLFLAGVALWDAERSGYKIRGVMLAGAAYGLALSAKLSTLVFGPIFGLLALISLVRWWRQGKRDVVAAGLRLGLLYLPVALLIVWAVFGFDWGLLKEGGPAGPMPIFWRGVGAIVNFSGGGRPAFLLGHFSAEGFWSYFPVAFGVKTPLPTLMLMAWAVGIYLARTMRRAQQPTRDLSLFLLLPPLLYFAISTRSALNLGYRHLLPILPYLYAFVGVQVGAARTGAADPTVLAVDQIKGDQRSESGGRRSPFLSIVLHICLLWLIVGNLAIYPHYLSSFNELVGPANGYQVLVDSNVDWGQDLKRLRGWMQESGVTRVKLAWFGSAYPDYYGIHYDPLPGLPRHFELWDALPFDPEEPGPGVYAISVSILQELHRRDEDKTAFAWFRAREPDDRVGYSILIYQVP